MSEDFLIDVIRNSRLFENVSSKNTVELLKKTSKRVYKKGEFVITEGKVCNKIGFILSGQIAVQKISKSGEYLTINILSAGELLGENLLYGTNEIYEFNLESVENTEVLRIPKDIFKQFAEENPCVKNNYLRILSDNITNQTRRIGLLSRKSNREKIACFLLELNREQNGQATGNNMCVELPYSKEVAAKYLAMPRPSFSREMSAMEKEGLILFEGKVIRIIDIAKLESEIVEGLGVI